MFCVSGLSASKINNHCLDQRPEILKSTSKQVKKCPRRTTYDDKILKKSCHRHNFLTIFCLGQLFATYLYVNADLQCAGHVAFDLRDRQPRCAGRFTWQSQTFFLLTLVYRLLLINSCLIKLLVMLLNTIKYKYCTYNYNIK